MLVSSHLLTEVAQTADELVVIRKGKLVAQTSLAEFTAGGRDRCGCGRADLTGLGERPSPRRGRGRATTATAPCWSAGSSGEQIGEIALRRGIAIHELAPRQLEPRGALPRADGRRGGRRVNLLRSEWLKLWTTRTTWMMLGIGLLGEALFAGLYVGLALARGDRAATRGRRRSRPASAC